MTTTGNAQMYRIRLEQFEGPLDLLLFFIRRDELDIYDIPIADIADEFLEYVRLLREVDLDTSGDFIYMASVLMNIKARMLLPGRDKDEDGEPIDPRRELVERLLEYVRFKEATATLEVRWTERDELFTRGAASDPEKSSEDDGDRLVDASVFDLVAALRRVLTTAVEEPVHALHAESYTLEEQMDFLRAALKIEQGTSFVSLVTGRSKSFIITTFLAVLELARTKELVILLSGEPDDFHLELSPLKLRAVKKGA
jgi:segregation and condensation protein A